MNVLATEGKKVPKRRKTGNIYIQSGRLGRLGRRRRRLPKRRPQRPRPRADWFACPTTEDQSARAISCRTGPVRNRFYKKAPYLKEPDKLKENIIETQL